MPTITDTFTRANSTTTLGSTESPVVAWTADNGTWGINTNQAYVVTQAGFDSRATIPVGQANMDVSAAITTAQDCGVMASYVDSGNYYIAKIISGAVTVVRRQAGSDNNLTTGAGTWVDGSTLRLVTNDSGSGTQVTAYIGATQVYTGLDTTAGRPAGTRAGFRDGTGGSPGTPRFDNLSVAYTVPVVPTTITPRYVRAEVAFTTSPDDPAPAFRDLTSRLDLTAGVSITRGRQDEYGAVQPGRCTLTLDNTDGELTAGRSGSSFYPNVKPSRRMRVTYRDPGTSGNLLSAEDASFESGTVGAWLSGGSGGPTLANSAVRAVDGTKSLLVTWGAGAFPFAEVVPGGLVIGRTYIFSASVYVPAGNPAVRLAIDSTLIGTASTVTATFQRISGTFTATSAAQRLQVWPTTSPTTGQQVWVDAVMVDEGTTLATFKTTAPPIEYRFDGYVEEWPTEWPGGGKYTQARITAVDLLARLGTKRKLRSVVEETILQLVPSWYFPLGEATGSTSAGDVTGTNPGMLAVRSVGAGGGTLTFGTGTGPGTDGIPAPQFAPTSATNGLYLYGDGMNLVGVFGAVTLEVTYATTVTPSATATIAAMADPYGFQFGVRMDTTGHLVAFFYDPWNVVTQTATSTNAYADGATRTVAATMEAGTLRLLINGTTITSAAGVPNIWYSRLYVGGTPKGGLFSGTISHVAAGDIRWSAAQHGDVWTSMSTGFSGERSDQRIARIASWAGIPTARQVLDVGQSTSIAHVDPTGKKPLDAMQQIADTENGVLFADRQGRLVFYSRARAYTAQPVVASVDAGSISADTTPRMSKQELVNDATGKRTDGGPEIRFVDTASASEHGYYEDSVELAVTSDGEVLSALQWRVNAHSQPVERIPDVAVDAMTDPTIQAQVRALDVWSRFQVTSAPTQAHASTWDLLAQGYAETIAVGGWQVTVNSTAYSNVQGWRVDDATYSQVDAGYRFVY